MYFDNGSQTVIQRNIIANNTARGYDFYQAGIGALNGGSCYGGGIYIASASPIIVNNVISNNVAQGGGGQDFRGGWSGNGSAGGNADGGGIHAAFGSATLIINNTFYGNKAVGGLGGSSISPNAGNGGNATSGALDAGSSAIAKNNIFANNQAIGGSVGGGANGSNGTSTDGALTSFTAANLSNNLYFGNTAGTNSNGGTLGSNTILADPLFVSSTNFHLQESSPARKAGTTTEAPATDFDGITRTNPPAIGAYDGSAASFVDNASAMAPNVFALLQNYPNPFNPTTNFRFTISNLQFVTLKVFDLLGGEVATLVSEELPAGDYVRQWNAGAMSSGVYFYRMQAGAFNETKSLILLK